MTGWQNYAKALVGGIAAALTALIAGYDDDSLTMQEVLVATLAFVTTFGAVFAVPNKPPS